MKKPVKLAPMPEPVAPPQPPVTVISPDGVVGTVAAEELPRALDTGYQEATPAALEENKQRNIYGKGVINQLEAGALGFLRGSTLGLSDVAMRALAPGLADTAAKLKKYNPDESIAGELASFVTPGLGAVKALGTAGKAAKTAGMLHGLVSSGGAGLGKIATKIVGENLAGHALGAGINMAAQSAVYQAAHNLSEDALGDRGMTAESILANTGQAAILGAGIGAALPVVARGTQAVANSAPVRYVVSGAAKQFAKFFDPDRSLQLFTGAMKKELGAETGKRFQTAVSELAHDSGASLYSAGEVALDPVAAKIVKTAPGGLPNQAGAYDRVMSIKKQAGEAMGALLQQADDVALQTGTVPSRAFGPSETAAIAEKIEKFRATQQISEATAARIGNEAGEIVNGINAAKSLKELHDIRMGLDARIGGKNFATLGTEEIQIIKEMRKIVSSKLEAGLGDMAKAELLPAGSAERWQKLNRLMSNLYTVEKPLEAAIARSESNVNVFGLRFRDIGIGAVGGGVLGGPAGAALGVANKALQTDTGLLARAAIGEKLQKLAWAEQLMGKTQNEIASSIKGFLSGADAGKMAAEGIAKYAAPKFGAPVAYAMSTKAEPSTRVKSQQNWFDETRKQILSVAGNPEQFAADQGSQAQPLANAAPGVADAIIGKQLQVYAYLANVMPKNPGMPTNIFTDSWKPADYEVANFRKVVQVARAPLTILKDLRAGTISGAQVDAVKTLYPRLYESILDRVRQEVTAPEMKTTYQQRLKLGQLFQGTEPTMAPEFIAAMQMPASKPEEPTNTVRPPGGSVKLSKNYATATERAANR